MTAASLEPRRWPLGRWAAAIALVFALQTALIFLLQSRAPIRPRPAAPAPVLRLEDTGNSWPLLALEDPTLFVLPNAHGFSGAAWLKVPPLELPSSHRTQPPRFYPLPSAELGATFRRFARTRARPAVSIIPMIEPALTAPPRVPVLATAPRSGLEIRGGLGQRKLLTPLALPPQTNADLLADSTVQLLVNAQGYPLSAVLLLPGSGSAAADQCALALARTARFAAGADGPTGNPAAGLTVGTLVFRWQTVPPAPATNAPPKTP